MSYRRIVASIRRVVSPIAVRLHGRSVNRILIVGADGRSLPPDFKERQEFYAPNTTAKVAANPGLSEWISNAPVLVANQNDYENDPAIRRLRLIRTFTVGTRSVFNVDFSSNPQDGWEWCEIARYLRYCKTHAYEDIDSAKIAFREAIERIRKESLTTSYIFGTGVSLEKASGRDWSDGYRIVCNTIVRDPDLWRHLKPHIVVAGDGIYHFGHTAFARAFRRDLERRLMESDAIFVYPAAFDTIVRANLDSSLHTRCIPIPAGSGTRVHADVNTTFELPAFGNVLLLLLLPLACTLSHRVGLWGFDGRAPTDKYFWSNSGKHTYQEYFDTLLKAHPAFFQHHVPTNDPNKYVRVVHGDVLDEALNSAEADGWEFTMLHESWTAALTKRRKHA